MNGSLRTFAISGVLVLGFCLCVSFGPTLLSGLLAEAGPPASASLALASEGSDTARR